MLIKTDLALLESVLPALKHKYVIHLYTDDFGNWYASIKPENKPSTKVSVEFYLWRIMRNISLILHSMEFPE